MGQYKDNRIAATLLAAVTSPATVSGAALPIGGGIRSLIVTWDITSAERDSANETYDLYITTSDGTSDWDVIHFPQVATTGAKRFTARILCVGLVPQNVTTAAPGVAAVDSGTLATVSGGLNAIKSLGAGLVRHGPIGVSLNYELVIAGTVATGIAHSIKFVAERTA
jgi:hypothetical protein